MALTRIQTCDGAHAACEFIHANEIGLSFPLDSLMLSNWQIVTRGAAVPPAGAVDDLVSFLKVAIPDYNALIASGFVFRIKTLQKAGDLYFLTLSAAIAIFEDEYVFDELTVFRRRDLTSYFWDIVRESIRTRRCVNVWLEHVARVQEERRIALAARGIIEDY